MEGLFNFNGRSESTFGYNPSPVTRSLCNELTNSRSSTPISCTCAKHSDVMEQGSEKENNSHSFLFNQNQHELVSLTGTKTALSVSASKVIDANKDKLALNELNYDVLDEILTYLPAKSLASLSMTSTLMKFLVNTKVTRFLELNYVERTLRSLYPTSMFMNDLHFLSFVENGFCSPTISCGFKHTAIVSKLGRVYTWGSNFDGELGHGDFRSRKVPTRIDSISNAESVSCGRAHTNVLTKDGRVYCFGENRSVPTIIEGDLAGKIVTSVSSGNNMSAFVTSEGELYVSGHGIVLETLPSTNSSNDTSSSQHDDETNEMDIVSTSVSDLYTPRRVSIGELCFSSDELMKDGTGNANANMAALNTSDSCRKFRIIQIAAGGRHLVILNNKGEVYTCGFGGMGQLGHGNTDDQFTPKKVTALNGKTIVFVAAGQYHTIAISSTGELFAFGYNIDDCLGLIRHGHESNQQDQNQEDMDIITSPRLVNLPELVVMAAAGGSQTLVLTSSNEIITFGRSSSSVPAPNSCGFSMFPSTLTTSSSSYQSHSNVPENPFQGVKDRLTKRGRFVQIAAGGEHSCALTDQGDIILSNRNILERASLTSQSRRSSAIDEQQLNKFKADMSTSSHSPAPLSSSSSCSNSSGGSNKASKKRLALTPISSLPAAIGLSLMNNQQAYKRSKHVHAL